MARILAAIGLAIAGAIPLSAGALGLGEIDLKSALNQSFSAEIPVVSEAPGDVEALRVVIAPVETFRQFGLDRPAFLSDFKFSIVARDTGAVVQISSTRPVVEPFVTLLLEISWPQGRLLREYTVLLDPPVFMTESVEAAVEAPTAGPSASTPVPSEETPMPSEERMPVKSAGTTSPRVAQPAAQPDVAENDAGMYGPVKRNDTLWGIAGGLVNETTSVSRNQMMLAIYQANPEAFTGNINRLKAGMILRIPSASEVELGSRDATAEVRRQNDQWRSAREEPQGGRLRLVPPPDSDTEPAAQAGAGEDQSTAVGAADTGALQGRVNELESQLDESQRQLQIRDQELEALQRQLAEISSQPQAAPVIDEPELAPEFDGQTGDDVESLLPEDSADASEDQAVAPAPVDVTPVPVERDEPSFIGALFTNPLVYISLAIVLLLAWLFARSRSKTVEEPATGRWEALDEEVPDEETHEATTRLQAQTPQDEAFVVEEGLSTPDEATDDGAAVSPFASGTSEDWGGLAEESETPLERTISTDSAVNLDQADPIAESDFHMAYGLYDQAADLLTKAVESEPERKDLRMKLLEVYFIWESQDGFLREAEALQQQIDDASSDPDWNKVLIMGKQICPDEALFAGDAAPVSLAENVDLEFGEDSDSDAIDIALDDSSEGGVDLEFDEVAESLDLDLTGAVDSDADPDSSRVDFDIGSEDEATQLVDDDDEAEISGDAPTMETPTIESPAMDSTMESPTIESPAMDSTMESPTIESPAMDSTMESPTIESKIGQWSDESIAGSEQTAEIELADLDLDLSGLDEVDDDALSEDSDMADSDLVADTLDFDVPGDETQQQPAVDDASGDLGALNGLADDVESTAEMRNLDEPQSGDTAEQPFVSGGDAAEQVNLAALADDDVMLDVGEPVTDEEPTAEMDNVGSSVDGATMTEVGTKLDLARAYIDMGDPEGARSILNEVLEEADNEQKQEAQKLLDDLVV